MPQQYVKEESNKIFDQLRTERRESIRELERNVNDHDIEIRFSDSVNGDYNRNNNDDHDGNNKNNDNQAGEQNVGKDHNITQNDRSDNEKNKNINTSKENNFGDSSMISAFMHALLCCENSHEYDSTFPILCLITNGTHTRNEYELIEYIKQCSKFEENNIHFDNGNFNNRMIDDSISTIGKIAIKNRNSNSSVNTNISVLLKDRASNKGNNLSEIKDETEIETLTPIADLEQLQETQPQLEQMRQTNQSRQIGQITQIVGNVAAEAASQRRKLENHASSTPETEATTVMHVDSPVSPQTQVAMASPTITEATQFTGNTFNVNTGNGMNVINGIGSGARSTTISGTAPSEFASFTQMTPRHVSLLQHQLKTTPVLVPKLSLVPIDSGRSLRDSPTLNSPTSERTNTATGSGTETNSGDVNTNDNDNTGNSKIRTSIKVTCVTPVISDEHENQEDKQHRHQLTESSSLGLNMRGNNVGSLSIRTSVEKERDNGNGNGNGNGVNDTINRTGRRLTVDSITGNSDGGSSHVSSRDSGKNSGASWSSMGADILKEEQAQTQRVDLNENNNATGADSRKLSVETIPSQRSYHFGASEIVAIGQLSNISNVSNASNISHSSDATPRATNLAVDMGQHGEYVDSSFAKQSDGHSDGTKGRNRSKSSNLSQDTAQKVNDKYKRDKKRSRSRESKEIKRIKGGDNNNNPHHDSKTKHKKQNYKHKNKNKRLRNKKDKKRKNSSDKSNNNNHFRSNSKYKYKLSNKNRRNIHFPETLEVKNHLINKHVRTRILCLGIGKFVNVYFLQLLCDIGRGFHSIANNLDDIEIELIHLMKRVASPVLEDIEIDIGVSHCKENPFNLSKQMIRYIRDYVTIEFETYPSRICDLYHSFDNKICVYYKYNVHHKVISKLKQNHISDKKYDSLNESLMIKMCHIYKPVSNVYVKGYTCDDRAIKLQIGCCNYNNVIKSNVRSKPIRVNLNVANGAMIEKRINILTAHSWLWEIEKRVEMYQTRHGFENDTSNVRIYKIGEINSGQDSNNNNNNGSSNHNISINNSMNSNNNGNNSKNDGGKNNKFRNELSVSSVGTINMTTISLPEIVDRVSNMSNFSHVSNISNMSNVSNMSNSFTNISNYNYNYNNLIKSGAHSKQTSVLFVSNFDNIKFENGFKQMIENISLKYGFPSVYNALLMHISKENLNFVNITNVNNINKENMSSNSSINTSTRLVKSTFSFDSQPNGSLRFENKRSSNNNSNNSNNNSNNMIDNGNNCNNINDIGTLIFLQYLTYIEKQLNNVYDNNHNNKGKGKGKGKGKWKAKNEKEKEKKRYQNVVAIASNNANPFWFGNEIASQLGMTFFQGRDEQIVDKIECQCCSKCHTCCIM